MITSKYIFRETLNGLRYWRRGGVWEQKKLEARKMVEMA